MNEISEKLVFDFREHLIHEEKSRNTIEKYVRDVKAFLLFSAGKEITREMVISYKERLIEKGYAVRSVNSMLESLSNLFGYIGHPELRVKLLKVQQSVYYPAEKELSEKEYRRLCVEAEKQQDKRLSLLIQTICSTGIRVSELQYITAEAVRKGEAVIRLKGKVRSILIVRALRKKLLRYISEQRIKTGYIFQSRNGKPMNRTTIWRKMKKLSAEANVNKTKVFPHNLRHLFARMFYKLDKDIGKLADILGHSSINTTRIYIMRTIEEHRRSLERLKLVV